MLIMWSAWLCGVLTSTKEYNYIVDYNNYALLHPEELPPIVAPNTKKSQMDNFHSYTRLNLGT